MQKQWTAGESVRETYDAWAPVYDEFNRGYMFERWTGKLTEKAEEAGVGGKRLLDIACGTGMSTIPMLDRGWTVTGCDISTAMLAIGREKVGERANLHEADMRELPDFGEFDLVWAINDPLNYLLDVEELEAAFDGMRRNVAADRDRPFRRQHPGHVPNLFQQRDRRSRRGGSSRVAGAADTG